MTYVVAWKTPLAVYLVADSVVTQYSPSIPQPSTQTAFGEANIVTPNRQVHEGAIKILHLGEVAFAFSGQSFYGYECAHRVKTRLWAGFTPAEALRSVLLDWLDPTADLSIVATFRNESGPILWAFNADGRRLIENVPDWGIRHLGSGSPDLRMLSETGISQLTRIGTAHDSLALALAWVQAYGLRRPLMDSGVGGAFLGLVCHAGGIEWHRDILFAITDDHHRPIASIYSAVRQNTHVVSSTFTGNVAAFGSSLDPTYTELAPRWVDTALAEYRAGRYSYVVLLNTMSPVIAVIAMNGEREHRDFFLRIRPLGNDKEELRLVLAPPLMDELNREMELPAGAVLRTRVVWRQYAPAGADTHQAILDADL